MATAHFILTCFLGLLAPAMLFASEGPRELEYELRELAPDLGVIALRANPKEFATIQSIDHTVLKIHLDDGVFVDRGTAEMTSHELLQGVQQLRGAGGVDLVINFKEPVAIEGREEDGFTRLVFVRQRKSVSQVQESQFKRVPLEDQDRIHELQELVRQLTLEVLELRRKLEARQEESQ